MQKVNKLLTPYNFTDKNSEQRIKYIVIHYVGALGGAKANCQYYAGQYIGASAHYFVGFDGEIWQSVEDADIAWHCGASSYKHEACRNSNSIGIELCVRKKNTASMGATDKDWYFEDATVESAVELTRYLMEKYGVPASNVIRHYDVTGKICPNPYVYNCTQHVWEEFKKKISNGSTAGNAADSKQLYRVRKSWGDAKSQIGAYSVLENAKAACKDGYTVYDASGKAVYGTEYERQQTSTAKGTQAAIFTAMTEEQAVAKIGELCKADAAKSGILASVSAAQMILESGYGKTELAQQANNAFGMKCSLSGNTWSGSAWDGSSKYTKRTKEQKKDGTEYEITADFRKYSCLEDSVADHSAYLLGAMNGKALRYAGLAGEKDYREAVTIIKNGGYATDTKYIDKVCSIIEKWQLDKLDNAAGSTTGNAADSKQLYRVRKSWEDAKSQLGAYSVLENAKAACKDSYTVYDTNGKAVYGAELQQAAVKVPFEVKVDITDLNIRTGAGTNYAKTGEKTGIGVFTITEVKEGKGADAGWGKLKSGAGWVSLDYCTRLA
ncbi:N-acetylmuramoyl-L-alanine amidase [Phascolarctobacterium faecium]|uniref:N-acetylmuramoyl-L-alanine amidase n=1 Tax=Phascolarctobacterium faecium TaxID=33025 RepID=UPI002047BC7C|nr:MAG TPA: N-acetylmuramoyl-L-alanine amidase [Caudoviricetes sp.]